jgi:hypothetical protein
VHWHWHVARTRIKGPGAAPAGADEYTGRAPGPGVPGGPDVTVPVVTVTPLEPNSIGVLQVFAAPGFISEVSVRVLVVP